MGVLVHVGFQFVGSVSGRGRRTAWRLDDGAASLT
jgi:hypothetical protein